MVIIKNEYLEVYINKMGAELEKVLVNNNNILWERNDTWKGQSPILFPICGGLKEGIYLNDNQKYEMPRHGLARRRIFEVKELDNDHAVFSLKYDNDTLKIYPFKFELFVKYSLDKKSLNLEFDIINLDDISLGEFIKEFKQNETISYQEQGIVLSGSNGSLIIKHDMKYMVFWQGESLDLLCIEGWDGLPDEVISSNQFAEKKDIIIVNNRIKRKYQIEIKK